MYLTDQNKMYPSQEFLGPSDWIHYQKSQFNSGLYSHNGILLAANTGIDINGNPVPLHAYVNGVHQNQGPNVHIISQYQMPNGDKYDVTYSRQFSDTNHNNSMTLESDYLN